MSQPAIAIEPEVMQVACKTILLVEDEDFVRNVTREVLEMEGFRVFTAASAKAALDVAEHFGPIIDLLLTDLIMPGMNGRELAAHILEKLPEVKVIFMSGYSDKALLADLAEISPFYLPKPFTLDTMLETIRVAFVPIEGATLPPTPVHLQS